MITGGSGGGTDFNPLRREGGDEPRIDANDIAFLISIHSAARAETGVPRSNADRMAISIHSAARAETRSGFLLTIYLKISIHSAARAETKYWAERPGIYVFQSTPPRGRRQMFPSTLFSFS